MTDKPNARELLKEALDRLSEVAMLYQNKGDIDLAKRIDTYLAAPSNACPKCDGKGWTAEHSADANAHDGEGNCNPGYCPVQVQCEACGGTGRATPGESAMEMVAEIAKLLATAQMLDTADAYDNATSKSIALIEGLQRRVPRKMLEEIGEYCYGMGAEHRAFLDPRKLDEFAAKHGVVIE